MSVELAHAASATRSSIAPAWRWITVVFLFLVQVVMLTVRFDSATLPGDSRLAGLLSQTPVVAQFVVAVAAALLVFGGARVNRAFVQVAAESTKVRFPWFTLIAQLAAFAVVFQLTAMVFEGGCARSPWVAAWTLATLCWVALGLAVAIPVTFWPAILEKAPRVFVISIVTTALAMFAGYAAEALWRSLAGSTFWVVERALSLFYPDVVTRSDDLVIGTSRFSVEIARTCSGLDGIGLIVVFLGTFLWCFRRELRFPHAFVLLPVAVVTIWVVNALRIATLIALGSSWSKEIALGGFHSQAGWIAFNAVALAFVAATWRLRWFRIQAPQSNSAARLVTNPIAPYLVPFLGLVATAMITAAFSSGFDRLYAVRVVVAGAMICFFVQDYRRQGLLHWTWSVVPFAIGASVFGIWMAAEPFFGADAAAHSTMDAALASMSAPEAYTWMIFRAIGSICIVPIAEELAFRGYLPRRLISADFQSVPLTQFSWFALLGSSMVFGLMHGRWLAGTVAGVLFALAMYRRGRLMDAIIAHATANALITAYVLATGKWAVWS